MEKFKRMMSLVLTLALVLGMLPPVQVRAETAGTEIVETTEAETTEAAAEETTEASSVPIQTTAETDAAETTVETEAAETAAETTEETEAAFALQPLAAAGLSVQTLPDTLLYTSSSGTTQTVGVEDGISLVYGDTSASGRITVTVSYGGLTAGFEVGVHTSTTGEALQDEAGYPESDHNYANDADITYPYTVEGAEYLKLTFSSSTKTEEDYDYLYDSDGALLGKYTGTELRGETITVTGDTVKIRLTSDDSSRAYGFSLDSIYAYVTMPVHEPSDASVYTDPTCTADGYTTYTCTVCGATEVVTDTGTACHVFSDGACTLCGVPEDMQSGGWISDTAYWAMLSENVLYIGGTGEVTSGTWESQARSKAAVELTFSDGITAIGS